MSIEAAIDRAAQSERTQVRGIAFAVGFFFSFRLAIVLLCVRLLGLEPSTGTALSIALDLLFFCLVCFDSLGVRQRTIGSLLRLPAVRWVILFLAFSCLSLAWSETASLSNSLVYWMGLVIDVANVTLLLRGESAVNDGYSMMKGFVWSTCVLALVAWMMPTSYDLRLGDEQFFNANEIGNVCAFAIFFAQYLTRCNQGQRTSAKFFLAVTLVRSLSKTTLVAFLLSESLLLILDRSLSRKKKILLIAGAFVLILSFWGLFEAYYDVYTTAGNQAETLSGRTAIWLFAMSGVFDRPWNLWIGHGFDSWWKVVPAFGNELFEARHAENEFLQQLYAYGVAGVVLLAGIYGSLYRQVRQLAKGPARVLLSCLLVFILIRGLAEADAFDLLLPLWAIVLFSVLVEHQRSDVRDLPANFHVE